MDTRLHIGTRLLLAAAALGLALLVAAPHALAQRGSHDPDAPLRVAADVGFAPFAIKQPDGEVVGFAVDSAREIAERLGRPGYEIVDVNWSAIFSGLFAARYEFNIAPTNITTERAGRMLFTEGYMETGLGVTIRAGEPDLEGPEGLEGKVVAVNNGSVSDTWATENRERYGFTVERYDKQPDAVQAVITRRAYATIADLPNSQYVATQNDRVKVGHAIYTGNVFGYPFRPDDKEFRDRVERIVEQMKLDGTYAEIHRKWFGDRPGPDSAMNKVWVGYGMPGFEGYSFEPHMPGSR